MKFDTFSAAVHNETKQAWFFAGRFIPMTDRTPARFKYWPINTSGERIGPAKYSQWDDSFGFAAGQQGQLQSALGKTWRVLTQYETLQCVAMGASKGGLLDKPFAKMFDPLPFNESFVSFRNEQGCKSVGELY
jgi:hypothetical protein